MEEPGTEVLNNCLNFYYSWPAMRSYMELGLTEHGVRTCSSQWRVFPPHLEHTCKLWGERHEILLTLLT